MPTGDPSTCTCVRGWWGVVPPPECPTHRPGTFATVTGTGTGPITWFQGGDPSPPSLSDSDIERIAQRVADLLRKDK